MLDSRTQERERGWVLVRGGRAQGAVQTHAKQTDTPRELVVLQLLDPATRAQRRLTDEKAPCQPSRGIPEQDLPVVIRHDRTGVIPYRTHPCRAETCGSDTQRVTCGAHDPHVGSHSNRSLAQSG